MDKKIRVCGKDSIPVLRIQTFKAIQAKSIIIQTKQLFLATKYLTFPISMQPNVVDLRYFKLWILLDQII